MPELVSILIPAYNAEKWIAETIRSALKQTWINKEIIIVDDGSSDGTLHIAKTFESKVVKVTTQRNKGASSARNTALSLAQGNYIQYLDADDLLAPDKISQQLKDSDNGLDSLILLSSAWGRFLTRPKRAQFKPDFLWQDLEPVDWILRKFIDNKFMANSSWLVSRRLIELGEPWDERLSLDDDGEYACRIVSRCERVKFTPEAKCYYRVGNLGSQSSEISNKALISQLLSITLCIEYLKSLEDSDRTRLASLKFLNDSFYLFYPDNAELANSARALALSLGEELAPPVLSLQSRLFGKIFGPKSVRKAKQTYNQYKVFGIKTLEELVDSFNR
ncbi:glycosyltransferase family 2 protein [Methylobacter psychrophilus]|uniref:glycosyltransferase family 2 protein n=1 Tax=Methylobacter psychrophilus TaxID=96941 RepID=UPI0021D4B95B|nr:glycosyltransferase family A protein [Methylobacter psychrophilus]